VFKNPFQTELITKAGYLTRTPEYYLDTIAPEIRDSLTPSQTEAVHTLLKAAIPKPNPKLVDLRFTVDLVLARFYVVLFVGQDRRQQQRSYLPHSVSRIGNALAAVVLLLGLNLLISLVLLLFAYLVKSAAGIDLFPDSHLNDQIQQLS
jgi:hypothetical protein